MLVLMVSATLTKYLGKGPLYPKDGFEVDYCRTTWWTNLLYLNNFINCDEGQSVNICEFLIIVNFKLKFLSDIQVHG
jgi:hypothetical protein